MPFVSKSRSKLIISTVYLFTINIYLMGTASRLLTSKINKTNGHMMICECQWTLIPPNQPLYTHPSTTPIPLFTGSIGTWNVYIV